MSVVLAVLTSDPNLLSCELHRLSGQLGLVDEPRPNAMGVGVYAQDEVLLRRFPRDAEPALADLAPAHESEALVYHAGRLPVGMSLEENTQPFRARRWLFAHQGSLPGFERLRAPLMESLPDFLQRLVRGATDSEVAFALFLKHLRETGHADDPRLPAEVAAEKLADTARELERAAAEVGSARAPSLNFVATNGQVLVATRSGEPPLYYTRLEGTDRCEVCGITPSTPEHQPGVIAHRRRLTVVVASHVRRTAGWVELSQGTTLAVGGDLRVSHLPAQGAGLQP